MTKPFLSLLAAVAMTGPAAAHHGWGSYDAETPLTLKAPIQEMSFDNPHGGLVLDAEGKRWHVVLAPPSRMLNRGLRPEMLRAGTEVVVEGYPSKVVNGELRAERVTVAGKTVELR